MTQYTTSKNSYDETIITRVNEDGSMTSFMEDPMNPDYQTYLASLNADSEGNK